MKNTLQLILLLPCILLFSLESNSAAVDGGLWDVEQSIEKTLGDTDSNDIDWTNYKEESFLLSPLPEELHNFSNASEVNSIVTYSFIRAPPFA